MCSRSLVSSAEQTCNYFFSGLCQEQIASMCKSTELTYKLLDFIQVSLGLAKKVDTFYHNLYGSGVWVTKLKWFYLQLEAIFREVMKDRKELESISLCAQERMHENFSICWMASESLKDFLHHYPWQNVPGQCSPGCQAELNLIAWWGTLKDFNLVFPCIPLPTLSTFPFSWQLLYPYLSLFRSSFPLSNLTC